MNSLESRSHSRSNSFIPSALTFESATAEVIGQHHPVVERSVLFTLTTMVVLIVLFISFKKLDRIVVATGRLVPVAGTITVQPLDKQIISRILVSRGDVVKKGTVLATCDPTFVQADLVGLQQKVASLVAQRSRMEAEEENRPFVPSASEPYAQLQASIQRQREIEFKSGVSDFDQRIKMTESQVKGLRDSEAEYGARLKIATEQSEMYKTLEQEQVTSHLQSITVDDQKTELERQVSAARSSLDASDHQLESLKEQRRVFLEKWRDDNLSSLVDIKNQLDQAQDDLAKAKKLSELVNLLAPPQLLILRGELGTGKTTLVKGIAQALDAAEPDEVTSPTFTLLHEYDGTREGKPVKLFHLDVYRLEGERQLETLGLDELLTPDALVLVEWGEKFKSIRKKATGEISIASAGGDARKISVTLKE